MSNPLDKLNTTMSQMTEKELEEARAAIAAALLEDERESVADLKRTGRIAADFMRGMDKMTVVLMSMVLKFGRAVTMTKVSLIAQGVGIILFVAGLLMGHSIASKLDEMASQQERLIKRINDTEDDLSTLTKEVKETKQSAESATEAAPKVVIDGTTGKPKLILQSEDNKTIASPVKAKAGSGSSAPSKDAPKKGTVEFNLDF